MTLSIECLSRGTSTAYHFSIGSWTVAKFNLSRAAKLAASVEIFRAAKFQKLQFSPLQNYLRTHVQLAVALGNLVGGGVMHVIFSLTTSIAQASPQFRPEALQKKNLAPSPTHPQHSTTTSPDYPRRTGTSPPHFAVEPAAPSQPQPTVSALSGLYSLLRRPSPHI